jgi:uncharacterized protein YggE
MKRYVNILISAVLGVVLVAGYLVSARGHAEQLPQPAVQQTETPMRTVQVSGTGMVQVQPDTAVVSLGVQTDADTARAALSQNNTNVQSLLSSLTKAGIASKDIQTQTLRLVPRYETKNNTQTLVGYTATNVVQVRTNKLDSLGSLLDQAVSNGANTIENISFEVSDPEKWSDQARQTAVENARHKAEQLAKLTGATLGPIQEIQETSNTPGPVIQSLAPVAQAAAVPVSPGSQSISVDVQVTWTLTINSTQ